MVLRNRILNFMRFYWSGLVGSEVVRLGGVLP